MRRLRSRAGSHTSPRRNEHRVDRDRFQACDLPNEGGRARGVAIQRESFRPQWRNLNGKSTPSRFSILYHLGLATSPPLCCPIADSNQPRNKEQRMSDATEHAVVIAGG